MRLALSVSMPAGAPVVGVAGEVDESTADDLYEFLATVIRQRGPHLGVDLDGVTSMDPHGVTALLRARRLAHSRGGDLTLLPLSDPARRALPPEVMEALAAPQAAVQK
jgi:anti-sigma B factor antagonist